MQFRLIPRRRIALGLALAFWTLASAGCEHVGPRMLAPQYVAPSITLDVGRQVESEHGMVVTIDEISSRVGARILAEGGNAVDAAIATAFALAVTHPQAGNIGGGGFMIVHTAAGEVDAIDYRETAPLTFGPDVFLNDGGELDEKKRNDPFLLVGVPGTIAGLHLAHQKHGTRPWNVLLQPAIDLAEEGFPISPLLASDVRRNRAKLASHDATRNTFFDANGRPLEAGTVLTQPALASVLRAVSKGGPDAFYKGWIAEAVARHVQTNGGVLRASDFARYEAKIRRPIRTEIASGELYGMPPPSSGGVAVSQILSVLDLFQLGRTDGAGPLLAHLTAESMKLAFRDRAKHLGDADFASVPVADLLNRKYLESLRDSIDLARATPSENLWDDAVERGGETTHFSVIDRSGMAVANTYTLEEQFGGGVIVSGLGFLLNNELGDFNAKAGLTDQTGNVGTAANLPDSGKRPLSSMSPSIFVRNGKVEIITGSPGGRTIVNTVAQVLFRRLFLAEDPARCVWGPRLHHQWLPDRLVMERDRWPPETIQALEQRGHTIEFRDRLGSAQSIFRDEYNRFIGVGDRRRDGWAAAPNVILPVGNYIKTNQKKKKKQRN